MGIPLSSLSSPQLSNGLILVGQSDAPPSYSSAFTVDVGDANSFGFSATFANLGSTLQLQYTDTASVTSTAICSFTYSVVPTSIGDLPWDDTGYGSVLCPVANTKLGTGPVTMSLDAFPSGTTYAIYVGQTTATMSDSLTVTTTTVVPGQTTYLATQTSTIYATTETVAATTTLTGEFLSTCSTKSSALSPITLITTTRSPIPIDVGSDSSTSSKVPSTSQTISPVRVTSSTRASSSSSTSSLRTTSKVNSSSVSKTSSSSIISSSSTKTLSSSSSKTSSSSRMSTLTSSTSSPKSTSTQPKTSNSKSSSKSSTSKSTSKTTSSKSSSRTTSSTKTSSSSVCSTGVALKSLSSYPSIASHLCKEISSSKVDFPASITVWPASQLSSACSCYGKAATTKVPTSTKRLLAKRQEITDEITSISSTTSSAELLVESTLASSSASSAEVADDRGFTTSAAPVPGTSVSETPNTDSASITDSTSTDDPTPTPDSISTSDSSSSSTSTSSTFVAPTGYGPPTIYAVQTITIHATTATVYSTADDTTLPVTTTTVSSDTLTVTGSSTVTVDERTQPTTCIPNSETVALSARSLSCTNLSLHTAFLWVMMKQPFDFCAYYLVANRNMSPLSEMNASTLKDTCSCLVSHKSAALPVFRVGASFSPKVNRACKQSVATLIKGKFKEPEVFCRFYASTARSISPFTGLTPGDVFAGCNCLA